MLICWLGKTLMVGCGILVLLCLVDIIPNLDSITEWTWAVLVLGMAVVLILLGFLAPVRF